MSDLLTAALDYAARGWHVFPLHPDSKRPARPSHRAADCASGGFGGQGGTDPHCRDGHAGWEQRATIDTDRIRRAWMRTPYGIGIATGPSGLVVVDLDVHKAGSEIPEPWNRFGIDNGAEVLDHLAGANGGTVTPTFAVRTASGGHHLYYRAPEGVRYGNTAGSIGWLVDTRAYGGYVVAAGTQINHQPYEVIDGRAPAALPVFLVDLLGRDRRPSSTTAVGRASSTRTRRTAGSGEPVQSTNAYVEAVLKKELATLHAAPEGGRNLALWCCAAAVGKLVVRGLMTELDAMDRLLEAASGHIAADAYSSYQAEATIRSGFHRAASRTRSAA